MRLDDEDDDDDCKEYDDDGNDDDDDNEEYDDGGNDEDDDNGMNVAVNQEATLLTFLFHRERG